ncbi:GNAT family N-acetyltransferase [Georgenia sp. AZ-5]|uniref:GNAT family N-acetyltransferase n=1 Tax=Georgenia sp. AZ-5 TaxID=3367526 RepID=UPI0037551BBC
MDTEVRQRADRFEILAGGEVAGFTQFLDGAGRRIFFHTEVREAYAGQGVGGRLVEAALRRSREEGLRVVPVCPYVAAYLRRHPEHADIVEPVTREALGHVRHLLSRHERVAVGSRLQRDRA